MATVEITLQRMNGAYDYANWDPDDYWRRENYCKLRLDRRTLDELGEPEEIKVTIERMKK